MGLAHDFQTILEGARRLAVRSDIHFVFIGDGPRKAQMETFVEKHGLSNVTFLPYQPYGDLVRSLNACDVALITMAKGVDGLVVPSKLYGILAAGKPFILVGGRENEILEIVRCAGVGRAVGDGDVGGFVEAVLTYRGNPSLLEEEGKRAREIFEASYSRRKAVERYGQRIRALASGGSAS